MNVDDHCISKIFQLNIEFFGKGLQNMMRGRKHTFEDKAVTFERTFQHAWRTGPS